MLPPPSFSVSAPAVINLHTAREPASRHPCVSRAPRVACHPCSTLAPLHAEPFAPRSGVTAAPPAWHRKAHHPRDTHSLCHALRYVSAKKTDC